MTDEVWTGETQWVVLFPCVVMLIGVCVSFGQSHYLNENIVPIPYAAYIFGLGAVMGSWAYNRVQTADDQLTQSILQWSEIDSQLLLLVFLPGLIFRDSLSINMPVFRACFSQIVLLAFPVVILGTFLIALVSVHLLNLEWTQALTLGSLLASTDPIAVSSVLAKAGAPPRLQMAIGGESLLNDGSAVVLYTIFSQQFFYELGLEDRGRDIDLTQGILIFLRMSLGGPAVGLGFALLLMAILSVLDRRLERENNVLQVAAAMAVAYLSYYVSEQVLQMSGVLACVTTGIVSAAIGRGLVRDPELMDSYLALLENVLNTLLFALGGVVWGEVLVDSDYRVNFGFRDWVDLLLLYLVVMAIRGIQIASVFPILTRIGLKTSWEESFFLAYAGFRGSVGVALALALDRTVRESTKDEGMRAITSRLIGLSGGVTFLTLVVNGTTAGYVLRKLGLAKPTVSNFRLNQLFEENAHWFTIRELKKLMREPRFSNTNVALVCEHVPFLKGYARNHQSSSESFSESQRRRVLQRGISSISDNLDAPSTYFDTDDEDVPHSLDQFLRIQSLRSDVSTEDLIDDLREIFIELLDPTYGELASCGQMDGSTDILRQAAAFCMDNVRHHEPIHDWNFTKTTVCDSNEDAWWKKWLPPLLRRHVPDDNRLRLRKRVLQAITFVEAHRRIERRLQAYLDMEEGAESDLLVMAEDGNNLHDKGSSKALSRARDAIEVVIVESRQEVAKAKEFLASIEETALSRIISHYVCTILLHQQQLFVEKSAKDGALTEKNARLYMEKVDRRLREVQQCTRDHD